MSVSIPRPAQPVAYLSRTAERLVLQGYRHWIRGTVLRSTAPWAQAQVLYRGLLGDDDGAAAIVALAGFTRTLGQCAVCPLSVLSAGCPRIARDETLVMGMVAGFQNVDEKAVHVCMNALCCPSVFDEVAFAAGGFALTLKEMGQVLLPIPARVVEQVAEARAVAGPMYRPMSGTIH